MFILRLEFPVALPKELFLEELFETVPFKFRELELRLSLVTPDRFKTVDRLRDTERVEPNFLLETKLLLTFRVFDRLSTLDAFALITLSALDTCLTEGCLPEREIFPMRDILFLLNATFDIRLA